MLRIYLMRHGIAESMHPTSGADRDRRLTTEGRALVRDVAGGLLRLGVEIDAVLTSPYVRAVETAEISAEVLGLAPPAEVPALGLDGDPPSVLRAAAAALPSRGLLLVSHEPVCGALLRHLLGRHDREGAQSSARVRFQPAAVCCVEVGALPPRFPGLLAFMAPPALLAR